MVPRKLLPVVEAVALALAAFLIYRALRGYSLGELLRAAGALPFDNLAAAVLLAAASYLSLAMLEGLALRYAGRRLDPARIALASFVSMAISYNLSVSVVGSSALRYHFYSRWGLSAGDVGRIVLFTSAAAVLGLTALAAGAFLFEPTLAGRLHGLGETAARLAGLACLAVVLAYLALAARPRPALRLWRWRITAPSLAVAAGQVAAAGLTFALAAAVLHQMLPAALPVAYGAVLAIFVLARSVVLVSNVPGGLGVLEAIVLAFLPRPEVVGALLAFRAIYYLVPLMLAGVLLATVTAARRRRQVAARS